MRTPLLTTSAEKQQIGCKSQPKRSRKENGCTEEEKKIFTIKKPHIRHNYVQIF